MRVGPSSVRLLVFLAISELVCGQDAGTRDDLASDSAELGSTEMVSKLRQSYRDYRSELKRRGLDDAAIDRELLRFRNGNAEMHDWFLAKGLDASGEKPSVEPTDADFERAASRADLIGGQLVERGYLSEDKLPEAAILIQRMIEARLRLLVSDVKDESKEGNPDQGELVEIRSIKQELAEVASGALDGSGNLSGVFADEQPEEESADLFTQLTKINREISQLRRVNPDQVVQREAVAELDRLQKQRIIILQQFEKVGGSDFDQSEIK